jgi:hypothetical protein
MENKHPNLLVMGAVLMASGAMGLPTSGFPNMSKSIPTFQTCNKCLLMLCSGHYDGRPKNRPAIS